MNRGRRVVGRPNSARSALQHGPPDKVTEMGLFLHACEGDMVCKSVNTKIPYFNAPIYLENKNQIGKVDEILGPMNELYFTIKLDEGIVATSFKPNDKVYIGEDRLLPLERFLPKPPAPKKVTKKSAGRGPRGRGGYHRGGRGGGRGAGQGFRGGRGSYGGNRGGGRGGGRGSGRGGMGGRR
uniref:H/ACA ribonucleoprotein complex subunit n=1 Tax=Anthurium amnicola TaxID=1678845 RepID=A0A1D1XR21_9ARAE